ncbi:MAG: hypothetical protein RLZZ165_129 [Bacteroidota bacterium]
MLRNASQNHRRVSSGLQTAALCALMALLSHMLSAQKVIVLTNADLGKVITGTHHFSENNPSLKLILRHRISGVGNLQVSLQKELQFGKSPFTLRSALPASLAAEGALEILLDMSYGRAVQSENTISMLAYPAGDADPKTRGITVNLKLTADGSLMFFSERTQQYSKSLPRFQFVGPSQKLIELSWNGGGSSTCRVKFEDSGRKGFSLIPNSPGAAPIADGSTITLNSGGNSYFIRYDGAAAKGTVDGARISFIDAGGQGINVEMMGTYPGGESMFATINDVLSREASKAPPTPEKVPASTPRVAKTGDGKEPKKDTDKMATAAVAPAPKTTPPAEVEKTVPMPAASTPVVVGQFLEETEEELGLTADEAKNRLKKFFIRNVAQNLVKVGNVSFEKIDGKYEARVPITIDSIMSDPNFHITPIWVRCVNGVDSVTLPSNNYKFPVDTSKILIKLSEEAVAKLAGVDSFKLKVGFMPDYLIGNEPYADKNLVFTGVAWAKVITSNFWKWMLYIGIALLVILIFYIGYLIARSPVNTFRYLRESRYQRERYKATSEREQVDVEVVHIDLARQDNDLVQLSFVDRGEGLDGRQGESIEKIKSINAYVPLPKRGGIAKMFAWLYGPFGRKRDRNFNSIYYSLRVEIPKGSIPQNLRLKDESGMIMLGTNLTGNVLATDHQDFKFSRNPFSYSVYLDPSEFLDYSGAMRTVTFPFRVIEEPFEGYVMIREFKLNLEIAQRY